MRFRKLLSLLLALALCLSLCAAAQAKKADPETRFIQQLSTLETYLRKNAAPANAGSLAVTYLDETAALKDMDRTRLADLLARYLGCVPTVPLSNMLASYAGMITSGSHFSILELGKLYPTLEAAATAASDMSKLNGGAVARAEAGASYCATHKDDKRCWNFNTTDRTSDCNCKCE